MDRTDDDQARSAPFRPVLRAGSRFAREAAQRPILKFEDVYKSYRAGAPVLRGMNLIIERGEFVFITGPSRSADIEFTPTVGVHGPKVVWVVNPRRPLNTGILPARSKREQ